MVEGQTYENVKYADGTDALDAEGNVVRKHLNNPDELELTVRFRGTEAVLIPPFAHDVAIFPSELWLTEYNIELAEDNSEHAGHFAAPVGLFLDGDVAVPTPPTPDAIKYMSFSLNGTHGAQVLAFETNPLITFKWDYDAVQSALGESEPDVAEEAELGTES